VCTFRTGPRKVEENPRASSPAITNDFQSSGPRLALSSSTGNAKRVLGLTGRIGPWLGCSGTAEVIAAVRRRPDRRFTIGRATLEAFKLPLDEVAGFRLVVFGTNFSLFTVDIESPELAVARLLRINGINEAFGAD